MRKIKSFLNLFHDLLFFRSDFRKLKRFSTILVKLNITFLYEKIIFLYDQNVYFFKGKKSFIGKGSGGGSLNSFRKVEQKERILFEKIYNLQSKEFFKIKSFYKDAFEEVNKILEIPKIQGVIEGKKLVIIYMDFLELVPLNDDEFFLHAMKVCQDMRALGLTKAQSQLRDFEAFVNEDLYIVCKERIVEKLEGSEWDIKRVFKDMESKLKFYLSFQHGDLKNDNLFKNCLIDWDKSSFYPIGYDVGYIFADEINRIDKQALTFIKENFPQNLEDKYFPSVCFFTFLFSVRQKEENLYKNDFLQLIPHFDVNA